ncbi:MAG TPA: hypothetical protein VE621_19240, partial [Bryobacteraceae bacterium]|nr:hypothetical protein [Bryobacteraceae bacterium]
RTGPGEPPSIYTIPSLGGDPKLIVSDVSGRVALSPDGRRIAYLKRMQPGTPRELFVSNLDGTSLRSLRTEDDEELIRDFAWSPDSKYLAATITDFSKELKTGLFRIQVSNGRTKRISDQSWAIATQLAYLPPENHIVLLGSEQFSLLNNHVWHVDVESGNARRLTNDANRYLTLSVAPKVDRILLVQASANSGLSVASASKPDQLALITPRSASADGILGIAWTPDNRLIYQSRASGSDELWSTAPDGNGQPKQLTNGTRLTYNPSVSPDGSTLYQLSLRGGRIVLWKTNLEGKNPQQVTSDAMEDLTPSVSKDGQSLLLGGILAAKHQGLWKQRLAEGDRVKLSDQPCFDPQYSADESKILCAENVDGSPRIATILPASGGAPLQKLTLMDTARQFRWSPSGHAVTFVAEREGVTQLFEQPLSGGQPKQLTHFPELLTYRYAWSPNGQQIAYARGEIMQDIVVFTNKYKSRDPEE